MTISFVANALGGTATTTTFSITLPATAADDLIILEYTHRATGDATIAGTYTGPAFTEKHDQLYATSTFSAKTLWSRATGNHSGQTVTGSGLTNACAAIVTVYRGALRTSDPLTAATIVGEQNVAANETQAEITTTAADAYVVLVVANSPDVAVTTQTCTSPGALTARAEVLSTGGTDASIAHASALKATAGATGAFTWAQTDGASGSWAYAITPHPDSAITQAAYQFYTDGTETGSTALATQDTAPTVDTSGGNVNLQLRARLQSTTAVTVPATDDWQLQWEKNTSGTWTGVVPAGSTVAAYDSPNLPNDALFDGYDETNANNSGALANWRSTGQSFTGNGGNLSRAGFYLSKIGTPATTSVTAELYAHTGTFGTTGLGTGTALATSTSSVVMSSVGTTPAWFEFDFDSTFTLVNGTRYVIQVRVDALGADSFNCLNAHHDQSSPTHPGNKSGVNSSGSWLAFGAQDGCFRVYATGGAPSTTNRLGAGTGSFVAGKVSEDGLVDDLGWSANNYTEVLYAVTLKQADLAPTDTLRFRVVRNGATTGLTYTPGADGDDRRWWADRPHRHRHRLDHPRRDRDGHQRGHRHRDRDADRRGDGGR